MRDPQPKAPCNVLVVMPSWVGDAVMATPTLRALREHLPEARLTALVRPYIRPVLADGPWFDRVLTVRAKRAGASRAANRRRGLFGLAGRLRAGHFDAAVLLRNSFSAALACRLAGVPRRIGYARDGRTLLLTDRLRAPRAGGRFTPTPIIDYYLALAGRLGAPTDDRRMALYTRPEDDARATALLAEHRTGSGPMVMLNPGAANMGDAKLWPAERFAAVADALIEEHDATVLLNGSPKERPILDAVQAAARRELVDLPAAGGDLTLTKSLLKHCDLAISNDSGGRHIAAAMGAPVISLFGPTDPVWTQLDVEHELILRAPADDRGARPMTGITTDAVIEAARRMLASRSHSGAQAS